MIAIARDRDARDLFATNELAAATVILESVRGTTCRYAMPVVSARRPTRRLEPLDAR
jgi:hypothetical protein